jgi:hypothetical protein
MPALAEAFALLERAAGAGAMGGEGHRRQAVVRPGSGMRP